MMAAICYAILDAQNRCINRVIWDGVSDWTPPANCLAVPDPGCKRELVLAEPEKDGE